MRRVINREIAVARREKTATQKEAEVELKERSTRRSIDAAKTMAKMIDDERAILRQREVAVQEGKAHLEARTQDLKEREVKVEGFLAEQRVGIERNVEWLGEANSTLETLGLSPLQVAEATSSLGAILSALDSATERLKRLESTVVGRLEAEG
jgi:hypothetical protein